MKKYLLILLAISLVFAFVSCKEDSGGGLGVERLSEVSFDDAPTYTGSGSAISSDNETKAAVGDVGDVSDAASGAVTDSMYATAFRSIEDLKNRTISIDGTNPVTVTISNEVIYVSAIDEFTGGSGTITLNGSMTMEESESESEYVFDTESSLTSQFDNVTHADIDYILNGTESYNMAMHEETVFTEDYDIESYVMEIAQSYRMAMSFSGDTLAGIIIVNLDFKGSYDYAADTYSFSVSGTAVVYDSSGTPIHTTVIDEDTVASFFAGESAEDVVAPE